jgi:DNA (cytosine-5)-methyltransferase 1
MRVLDLFSGIGGFSLAAHWMGWETAAFVEKEPFCQKVLNKNFPNVPIYDDVRTFPGKSFRGRVDIITGGFPCQPFSQAGKREGRNDERHLFPAMLDIIRNVRPSWVVAENVRGLLSIESGSVFEEVVTSLEREGYEVVTFCIPASAVNAPHRRDRLWIAGYSDKHKQGTITRDDAEVCGLSETQRESEICSAISSGTDSTPNPHTNKHGESNVSVHDDSRCRQLGQLPHNADGGTSSVTANAISQRARSQDGEAPNEGRRTSSNGSFGQLRDLRNLGQWDGPWLEAATRLCGMDARLPNELDITGSRDNRVGRLKSLGNSIVPQIVYEIFKAIDATK